MWNKPYKKKRMEELIFRYMGKKREKERKRERERGDLIKRSWKKRPSGTSIWNGSAYEVWWKTKEHAYEMRGKTTRFNSITKLQFPSPPKKKNNGKRRK